jgi:chromosome segregation ATPase
MLREARSWLDVATEFAHLGECRQRVDEAMRLLKEKVLVKEDRDECWKLWRDVDAGIPGRRQEICDRNYEDFRRDVHRIANLATYGEPRQALDAIQEVQREIKPAEVTRDQRQRIRESLQEYWDVARRRIDERRAEGARKHEEWREKMDEKRDRLEALAEKNEGLVERLREEIDDLESKIEDAWNEDWAERARGWVQEKYEKIADIERTNEELEEKIREIRSKFNGER